MKRGLTGRILAALAVTSVAVVPVQAQLDLAHPTFTPSVQWFIGGDVDRTVAFTALSGFGLTFAGIRMDPLKANPGPLRATLRAATPGSPYPTRGAILAQNTINITDTGLGFYDVPLAFALVGGNSYDIAFDIVGGGGWGFFENYNMEFYFFDANTNAAYNVGGQVQVLDGGCFGPDCGNYDNTVMPRVRFGTTAVVVPEPSSYALVAAGLGALALARRRRRIA